MEIKKRQSGIELMRIIAIFMIMITHATYLSFGFPALEEIRQAPVKLFSYIGVENITIICVNVFVLISGWFGIRPNVKKVGGLIFQCLFFGIVVQAFFHIMGIKSLSLRSINDILTFLPFVNSYIVLCLISPILNTFCEHTSKKDLRNFLLSYYLWGFLMGWLLNKDMEFYLGKTVCCFIGLYLCARYIRLHVDLPTKIDKAWFWGGAWFFSVFLLTLVEVLLSLNDYTSYVAQILTGFSISYISPFVILNSILFFLCFRKIDFSSNLINWLAISAFASVLLHGNMEAEYYCPLIKEMYANNPMVLFLAKTFGFMCAFFIVGVILDKIRVYLWNILCPRIVEIIDGCRFFRDRL